MRKPPPDTLETRDEHPRGAVPEASPPETVVPTQSCVARAGDAGEVLEAVLQEARRERDWAERLEPGAVLGRYVVVQRLGGGGAGLVYGAFDPDLDRKVAIKLLRAVESDHLSATQGQA